MNGEFKKVADNDNLPSQAYMNKQCPHGVGLSSSFAMPFEPLLNKPMFKFEPPVQICTDQTLGLKLLKVGFSADALSRIEREVQDMRTARRWPRSVKPVRPVEDCASKQGQVKVCVPYKRDL